MREASQSTSTHALIVEDFNYPDVDWNTWKTEGDSTDGEDYNIVESLRDGCWFQHVTQETRGRGTNKPNLLDLILTNKEDILLNIQHQSPLGKSDHCCLVFNFNCRTEITDNPSTKFYYDRGEYVALRQELSIDWQNKLTPHTNDPERQCRIYKEILLEAQKKHIPSKEINQS